MGLRKLLKPKQERLIPGNHIIQKKILDSLKICLTTKSDPASTNGSKNIHGYFMMSLVTPWHAISACTKNSQWHLKTERLKKNIFLEKCFDNWKKYPSKFDKHQRSHWYWAAAVPQYIVQCINSSNSLVILHNYKTPRI